MSFARFIYNLIGWKNKSESLETPLGAVNLNKMDSAIKTIGDNLNSAYDELSEDKLDKDTAYTMVSDVAYNKSTGVFTVTKLNGSSIKFDTNLEKIMTNWVYDKDSQKLILSLEDGTIQEVDLSALITQYEFTDTDTVAFSIQSDGKVTANVKDGSITDSKLQPNYLADITTQASSASVNAQNASNYASNASYDAKLSQSYSVGGSGVRANEDTDNSKYYSNLSKGYMEETKKLLDNSDMTNVLQRITSLETNTSKKALYKELSPGVSVSLANCKIAIIVSSMGGSSGSVQGTWIYTSYGGALRELENTGAGKPSLSGTTLTIGATSMSGGAIVYGWS